MHNSDASSGPRVYVSGAPPRQRSQTPAPGQLPALTSLRFIAAFWVVLFHFRHSLSFNVDSFTPLFEKGEIAVDFFFVLSGFVLAYVYLGSVERQRFSSRDFLLRRFARIYPMHLATLGLLTLWAVGGMSAGPGGAKLNLDYLPANLLLVHAWGVTKALSFNGPSWSISAEWFAYLGFPVVAGLMVTRRWPLRAWLIGALLLLGVSWVAAPALTGRELTQLTYDFGVARIAPEFTLGMIACCQFRRRRPSLRLSRILTLGCGCGLLLAAALDVPQVLLVGLCPPLIFGAAGLSAHGRDGILASPALLYLGEVSYSVYLIHPLVRRVWSAVGARLVHPATAVGLDLLWLACGLVAVLGAAMLCYHWIELPSRQLLVAKARSRPVPAAVAGPASR